MRIKKLIVIPLLLLTLILPLVFVAGCSSQREFEFSVQRIGLQVPYEMCPYISSVSGVRRLGGGILRVNSHSAWIRLLDYYLGYGMGYPTEFYEFDEHHKMLRTKYSRSFFRSNVLILLGLTKPTLGGGGFYFDDVFSPGGIYFSEDPTLGDFMAGEDWTFAIAVRRPFSPSKITLNITILDV